MTHQTNTAGIIFHEWIDTICIICENNIDMNRIIYTEVSINYGITAVMFVNINETTTTKTV